MKLSTDRILTTHVGSLPRPQPLVELLIKRDRHQPYDAAEFRFARRLPILLLVRLPLGSMWSATASPARSATRRM
jgi:5-methyltetrahydropteroyltriglutamate--homocysteine methyltransferase